MSVDSGHDGIGKTADRTVEVHEDRWSDAGFRRAISGSDDVADWMFYSAPNVK